MIGIAALSALVLVTRAVGAARRVTKVAVIAHAGKSFGGGLPKLRQRAGAPGSRRSAVDRGAEEPLRAEAGEARARRGRRAALRLGRRRDRAALHRRAGGLGRALAILPAGTANLLATNLGIPQDIEQAVAIGLHGERRKLDVGRFNGEQFAVMAGAGFDAAMIQQADGTLKDRLGRVAYVWTGSQNLRAKPFKAKIEVDGAPVVRGRGELHPRRQRRPPLRRRRGVRRTRARTTAGSSSASSTPTASPTGCARSRARPSVSRSARRSSRRRSAKKIKVKLNRKVLYEIDGGDREKVKSFTVKVQPARDHHLPTEGGVGRNGNGTT